MIQQRTNLLRSWAPMPRYLLRRFIMREAIEQVAPRDFIEVGAGTGDLALWMHNRGMAGTVTEVSPIAIQMLHERLAKTDVEIHAGDFSKLEKQTDLLLSMEVLEHIEDDEAMLRQFFDRIRPGGHVLLSVPARQKMFSIHDEMVGHCRRYERDDLSAKLVKAGFQTPTVLNYGFPLGLLLRHVRNHFAKKKIKHDARSQNERTQASGVERDCLWLRWIMNDYVFFPFHLIQLPFLRLDWADGYVAMAQKPVTGQ